MLCGTTLISVDYCTGASSTLKGNSPVFGFAGPVTPASVWAPTPPPPELGTPPVMPVPVVPEPVAPEPGDPMCPDGGAWTGGWDGGCSGPAPVCPDGELNPANGLCIDVNGPGNDSGGTGAE